MSAVGTVRADPLGELPGIAGTGGALADAGANLVDMDGQRIPRLRSVDINGTGLRVAEGDRLPVTAILVGSNLPRKRIFGLYQHPFSRLDP